MNIHLVDGTYELFRAYFAMPKITSPDGRPVGAVRGIMQTLLLLLRQEGTTHVACAFDHEVMSFRNDMFDGYKTGEGISEDLLAQFDLAEQAAKALGIVVWPMIEFEADDVIASAAHKWADAPGVDQIVMCTPDKDLAQMVLDPKIVALDRRRDITLDTKGVVEKFGVMPESIPDYLALVGDSADGIPGIPRWGAKSASIVLARYMHLEQIPSDVQQWDVTVRGAATMSANLEERRSDAALYKALATLRLDVPISETVEELEWLGVPRAPYKALCAELGFDSMLTLPHRWLGEDA